MFLHVPEIGGQLKILHKHEHTPTHCYWHNKLSLARSWTRYIFPRCGRMGYNVNYTGQALSRCSSSEIHINRSAYFSRVTIITRSSDKSTANSHLISPTIMKTSMLSFSLSAVFLSRSALARPAPVSKLVPRGNNVYTKCKKSGDFALTFDE